MAETTRTNGQPVQAPESGQTVVVNAIPGQDILLAAAFDQAEIKMEGGNVVFAFANGGQVVLDFTDLDAAQAPNIVMADGSVLDMQEYLAALGEGEVEPAAGPDAGGADSGGVGEYQDDAGNLIDGVDKLNGLDPRDFTSITVEGLEASNLLPSLLAAGIVDAASDEDGLRISDMTPFDGNDDGRGGDHPAQFAYVEGSLAYDFGNEGPAGTDPFVWGLTGLAAKGVTSQGHTLLYEVVDGGLTLNAYYMGMPYDDEGPKPSDEGSDSQEMPSVKILVFSLEVTDLDTGAYRFELYRPLDHSNPGSEDDIVYNFIFTLSDGAGDSVVGGLNMIVDDDSPIWTGGESSVSAMVVEEAMSYDDGDFAEGSGSMNNAAAEMPSSSTGTQGSIEAFLGVAPGGLSPLAASGAGYDDAFNGSAMKSTFTVEAGDEITFAWAFSTDESGGNWNDFSFVTINGEPVELADISTVGFLGQTPFATFTHTATSSGPLVLGFGVMNTGDDAVNSYLRIDDIKVNGVTVPNGGFENGNFSNWEILGDPSLISNALYTDEASGQSGSLADLVSFGADGPGEFSLLSDTSELPSLFSDGEPVQYIVEGDTLTAYVGEYPSESGEGVVFTLQVNPDGSWFFDLKDQLDHVDDGTDSKNLELITGEDGESVSSVSAIDFSSLLKVTDGDGDELMGAPEGSFTIQVQDDVPLVNVAATVSSELTLTNHNASAGYNNSFGYYIKGDNGEPLEGVVIWDNVKAFPDGGTLTIDGYAPDRIGFFIIPDGDRLNDGLDAGAKVAFLPLESGGWQAYLTDASDAPVTPLLGRDAHVLFDVASLNEDGLDHVMDKLAPDAPGNLNWEDIPTGGAWEDFDYNDVNITAEWKVTQTGTLGEFGADGGRVVIDGIEPDSEGNLVVTGENGATLTVDTETTEYVIENEFLHSYAPPADSFDFSLVDGDNDTASGILNAMLQQNGNDPA
jgi:hypothetical protein